MEIRNHVLEFSTEIKRKGYRDQSVKNYVSCVEKFLNHFMSYKLMNNILSLWHEKMWHLHDNFSIWKSLYWSVG